MQIAISSQKKKKKPIAQLQIPEIIVIHDQEEAKGQPIPKETNIIEIQTENHLVKQIPKYQSLKQKKKKYKELLDDIQKQKDWLISQIADKDSKIKQFKDKSSKNEIQISDKHQDLEQAKQKWKTKKSNLKKQMSEKDSQQRQDKIQYEEVIREKERQLNDIIEAMQAIKQENTDDKDKLKKSKMTESQLKRELQQNQTELQQLRELQSEKLKLETQIKQLTNEVRELRYDRDVVHDDMLQLNNNLQTKLLIANDLLNQQKGSGSIIQSDFQNQLNLKNAEIESQKKKLKRLIRKKIELITKVKLTRTVRLRAEQRKWMMFLSSKQMTTRTKLKIRAINYLLFKIKYKIIEIKQSITKIMHLAINKLFRITNKDNKKCSIKFVCQLIRFKILLIK